jgi:hypothetical protein
MIGFTKKVILFSLAAFVVVWNVVHSVNKTRKYEKQWKDPQTQWCTELHFLKRSSNQNNSATALASFPGSGNTWLRFILQQATGIYTSSVYGESSSLTNRRHIYMRLYSTLAVKTHRYGNETFEIFDKAVLLIRDPLKSILAEYNRLGAGKRGLLKEKAFTGTRYRRSELFLFYFRTLSTYSCLKVFQTNGNRLWYRTCESGRTSTSGGRRNLKDHCLSSDTKT